MFKLVVFISFLFVSAQLMAQDLDLFDREIIVNSKIKSIYEIISEYKLGDEPEDSGGPCVVYYYKFDPNGNIVEHGLGRISVTYGFQYGKDGRLVSWSWDYHEGERIVFTENNYEHGNFKEELQRNQSYFDRILSTKKPLGKTYLKEIRDVCANYDGQYAVRILKESNSLPIHLKAVLKAKLGELNIGSIKTPEILYVSYQYEYYAAE